MGNYNTYDFNADTPFIPLKGCDCDESIDSLKEDLKDALCSLNEKIRHTNNHINFSADKIIGNIHRHDRNTSEGFKNIVGELDNKSKQLDTKFQELDEKLQDLDSAIEKSTQDIIGEVIDSKTEICLCNIATKKDIKEAIDKINEHTDKKFSDADIFGHFEDLNKKN